MARGSTFHRCGDCGAGAPKWAGRCTSCGRWGSLVEAPGAKEATLEGSLVGRAGTPRPIAAVLADEGSPGPTGVGEFDRVLGGGLVPGSVTLLGGEPGMGKSTLLLQTLAGMAGGGRRCLYVTAEESADQVRRRAERVGSVVPELWLVADTAMPHLLTHLDSVEPAVVAVDSVQGLHDPALSSAPGSVTQVRECASRLVREAKSRTMATVVVGHVTKDGTLAGPRALEHLVDTVLSFEGDRHHALRLLRSVKHRYGATDELGLFEMTAGGLVGVPDASALFLADRRPGVPGSVVAPVLEGNRPILVEVQALVSHSAAPSPRRSAHGLDPGRLALVLAVLEKRLGVSFRDADVMAAAAGGVRAVEPGVDLALALALDSARRCRPLPEDLVACGEVGLGGELRQVFQTARRLAEAARLGFARAVVPVSAPEPPQGIAALRAATLVEAVELVDELVRPAPDSALLAAGRPLAPSALSALSA